MKKRMALLLVAVLVWSVRKYHPGAGSPALTICGRNARRRDRRAGAGFEEEYGVTLNAQQLAFGDIRDQLRVAGPAGEGPDVIVGAHDWLGELVLNGLLSPVDLGDAAADFSEVAINAFSYDGTLYGVPYATENIAFFYNTDLVETPPATWAEVRTLSEEIMDSGAADYGYIRQEGDPYHFFPIQTAFGGYVFGIGDDGAYDPTDVGIDAPGSIAALQWLQDMVKDGLIPTGLDGVAAETLFQDGSAAMYITGPWNIQKFVDAGLNFAIARPFRRVKGGEPGSVHRRPGLYGQRVQREPAAGPGVPDRVRGKRRSQLALYEKGNRTPALLSAMEQVGSVSRRLGEAGAVGLPIPAIPEMSAVWTAWGDSVTKRAGYDKSPRSSSRWLPTSPYDRR